MEKQKIIVIVGPTASGKSVLAVQIARSLLKSHFNRWRGAEIISADSRQVYKELEIGSGAVTQKEMRGVRHHLIGVAAPRDVFTAAHFVAAAKDAIADITRRGKVAIVAGGTAFWVNALVSGMSLPEVPPDMPLRQWLEKKPTAALFAMLKKADPRRASSIEPDNPRRLIRAIEIARALGRVPHLVKHSVFNTLWLGLNPRPPLLARRIRSRAERMIRDGLAAETRALVQSDVPLQRIREFGFEYRTALLYNRGAVTRKGFAARLTADTLSYSKQQMRWWQRNTEIVWLKRPEDAISRVRTFLRKSPGGTATTRPARARGLMAARARPRRPLRRDS